MLANTRLQIIRGERVETDLYDEEDIDRVVGEVTGHITDSYSRRDKNSGSPSENDAVCRVPSSTDIRIGDRLTTHEGQTYVVRGKQKARLVNKDVILDLERISGSSA